MPFFATHMKVAEAAFSELDVPEADNLLGYALLGSTAPDRRMVTHQPREETHYFNLTQSEEGDGIRGMFRSSPDLRNARNLAWQERAFLAGYLSHLALDEAWITRVYRPYFGNPNSIGSNPHHNILDRALQYSLNLEVNTSRNKMDFYHSCLEQVDPQLCITLVDVSFLSSWLKSTTDTTTQAGSWTGFERFIGRFKSDPNIDHNVIEAFLKRPESMLELIFQQMPGNLPAIIVEHAIKNSITAAQEYLI